MTICFVAGIAQTNVNSDRPNMPTLPVQRLLITRWRWSVMTTSHPKLALPIPSSLASLSNNVLRSTFSKQILKLPLTGHRSQTDFLLLTHLIYHIQNACQNEKISNIFLCGCNRYFNDRRLGQSTNVVQRF